MASGILASGQLPSTIGDLYVVPTADPTTESFAKCIDLVNKGIAVNNCEIFAKTSSGATTSILYVELDPKANTSISARVLSAGDAIQGVATVAGEVHYTIFGVEEP